MLGLNKLFNRSKELAVPEKKNNIVEYYPLGAVEEGSTAEWIVSGQGCVSPAQAAQFYRSSNAVAVAVDMIAEEIEKIMPVLKVNNEIVDTSPVLDLLRSPNPFATRQKFIGDMARNWLLNHDAFCMAAGNFRSPPASLFSVKPQEVTAEQNNSSVASQYSIYTGTHSGRFDLEIERGRVRYLDKPIKELYHISGYASFPNRVWSDSPLQAALTEARQQIQGRYHNLQLLQNGGRLSLVAVFRDRMSEEQMSETRQALNEQIGGAANAGKIAVIGASEMEFQEMSTNNKDMDYSALDDISFKAIMLRYKIPLPLVTDSAQTFDNFSEAVFQLYDRAVLPNYDLMMSGIGAMVLPRFGLDPAKVEITYDPESIESLRARRLDELLKRRELNLETVNEMREGIPGREPVTEGGDTIYQSSTLVPLGEDPLSEASLNADDQAGLNSDV